LEETDTAIKVKALEKLFRIIDVHWAEVCDSLAVIEELSEDASFPAADLAAAVASKCFFHLQSYGDSLKLALRAGTSLCPHVVCFVSAPAPPHIYPYP
jgi:26S proteasome regulatory subunit N2